MTLTGLKRSMPCLDLSSMSSSGGLEDALQVLEGRAKNEVFPNNAEVFSTLMISSSKRQKRSENNPASAALEEALKQLENDENLFLPSTTTSNKSIVSKRTNHKMISTASVFDFTTGKSSSSSFDFAIHDEHSKMFSKSCTNEVAYQTCNWALTRMTT